MSFPTPEQVERSWLHGERSAARFLARAPFSDAAGVAGALLFAWLTYAMIPYALVPFRSFGHVEVSRLTIAFFPAVLLAAVIPRAWRSGWSLAAVVATAAWMLGLALKQFAFPEDPLLFLSFPALMAAACALWVATRRGLPRVYAAAAWTVVFVLVAYLIGGTTGNATRVYWRFMPQYYFFFVISHLLCEDADERTKDLIFSPGHLAFPLVFPVGTSAESDALRARELWWDGFLRFARGFLVGLAAVTADSYVLQSPPGPVAHVLWRHFYLLLVTIAVGNVPVGLAQMFGVRAPPGTFFVFLARGPLDFWKRDSTYAYHFAIRFIFLPAVRALKSGFLALAFSFLIFYVYRQRFLDIVAFFYEKTHSGFGRQVILSSFPYDYLFWLGWFAVILLNLRFWFSPSFARRGVWQAWAPVLATHALMALPQAIFLLPFLKA